MITEFLAAYHANKPFIMTMRGEDTLLYIHYIPEKDKHVTVAYSAIDDEDDLFWDGGSWLITIEEAMRSVDHVHDKGYTIATDEHSEKHKTAALAFIAWTHHTITDRSE